MEAALDPDPPDGYFSRLCNGLERRLVDEGLVRRNRVVLADEYFAPDEVVSYAVAAPLLKRDASSLLSLAERHGFRVPGGVKAVELLKLKLLPPYDKHSSRYTAEEMALLFNVSLELMSEILSNGVFKPEGRSPWHFRDKQKEVYFSVFDQVFNRLPVDSAVPPGFVERGLLVRDPIRYLAQTIEKRIMDNGLYDRNGNRINIPDSDQCLWMGSIVPYSVAARILRSTPVKLNAHKFNGNPLIKDVNVSGLRGSDLLCLYLVENSTDGSYSNNDIARFFGSSLDNIRRLRQYLIEKSYPGSFNSVSWRKRCVRRRFRESYDLVVDAFLKNESLLKAEKLFSYDEAERYVLDRLELAGMKDDVGYVNFLLSCRTVDIGRSDLALGQIVYRDTYDRSYLDPVVDRYVRQRRILHDRFQKVPVGLSA